MEGNSLLYQAEFIGISFASFLFLHLVIWRVFSSRGRGIYLMAPLAGISYVGTGYFIQFTQGTPFLQNFFLSAPVYALVMILYVHLYVAIDRSVSIRIIGELVQSADRTLSFADLHQMYPFEWMVIERIKLMIQKGWLIEKDGYLECAPRIKTMAHWARIFQRLYRIDVCG